MKYFVITIGLSLQLLCSNAFAQIDLPVVDPATELRGTHLVRELQRGGYVLYMRHAVSGPGTPQCNGQSALTAVGEEQSVSVGNAFRSLHIPVDAVWSSQTCRTEQTAQLLNMGKVQTTTDLNPASAESPQASARTARLNTPPAQGHNTLLVAHVQGSGTNVTDIRLGYAEVIVYQPKQDSAAKALARIPLATWTELISLMAKEESR